MQFFAVSGIKGIIAALIFLVLSSYFSYSLFGLGQIKKFENPYDVFEYYCGKFVGQAYIWYSILLVYGIFVVMLAGGGATINQYYGVPTYLGTGAIAILALGTALLGVEKLIDIISVIGPVKIVFIISNRYLWDLYSFWATDFIVRSKQAYANVRVPGCFF